MLSLRKWSLPKLSIKGEIMSKFILKAQDLYKDIDKLKAVQGISFEIELVEPT